MHYPLPDVIDPGEFECVRIYYPKDKGYRRAVLGAVSYLQNWFAWERDNDLRGKEAATVFRQAYSLTVADIMAGLKCGDSGSPSQPVEPPDLDYPPIGGGDIWMEDEEMGCAPCLRWNNGILEMLSCGEWVPVPGIAATPPNQDGGDISDPDEPHEGDDPEVDQNVKCRTGYMIAHAMWRVHERILDYVDDVFAVFDIGNKVAADLPEYTLTKYHLSLAAASLIAASATVDLDLVFVNEADYTSDMAHWMGKFLPSKYSLTRVEYELIAAGLLGYSFHEGIEINLGQLIEGDYWRQVFWALGPGTVNDLMAQARTLSSDEFDCDDHKVVIEPPPQTTFVFLSSITKTGGDGTVVAALSEGRTRIDFTWAGDNYSASCDFQGSVPVDCSTPIQDLLVRVQGINGDIPPTVEWQEDPPFVIDQPNFGTAPDSVSVMTEGTDYKVFAFHWNAPVKPTVCNLSFKYPGRYPAAPFELTFYYHVLSADA